MTQPKKRKRAIKPKSDKQDKSVDGLGVSFEDAMKILSTPKEADNKDK